MAMAGHRKAEPSLSNAASVQPCPAAERFSSAPIVGRSLRFSDRQLPCPCPRRTRIARGPGVEWTRLRQPTTRL